MDFDVLRDLDFNHLDNHTTISRKVYVPAARHTHSVLAAVVRTCRRLRNFDWRNVDIHSAYATAARPCINCGQHGSEIFAWYKSLNTFFHFEAGSSSSCHHIRHDLPLEEYLTITAAFMPDDDPTEAVIQEAVIKALVMSIEETLYEELDRSVASHSRPN